MRASATASAPGRLCLAGESLDWMIGGSSVVTTVPLRTRVTAWKVDGSDMLSLVTGTPLFSTSLVSAEAVAEGKYGGPLDHMQAAARVVLQTPARIAGTVLSATTDLPVAAGLSSSAALTVAAVTALMRLDGEHPATLEVTRLAREAETHELRTGAGWMDFLACTYGGVNRVNAAEPSVAPIAPTLGIPVVIIDTNQHRTTTQVLASKRDRFASGDARMHAYARQASALVDALTDALESSIVDFGHVGSLINTGHALLRDLVGCSTPLIDECAQRALTAGALGAKLSGSGYGGALFALVPDDALPSVINAMSSLPVHVLVLPTTEPQGVAVRSTSAPVTTPTTIP
ncbi:hypothetical protein [Streptomyces luteireticuli]|uniref:mevalonate kinase n=1 Tax=Streptomyces luteireticuli TaxID=173858 RepID=A0ABP3IT44_9ACTN